MDRSNFPNGAFPKHIKMKRELFIKLIVPIAFVFVVISGQSANSESIKERLRKARMEERKASQTKKRIERSPPEKSEESQAPKGQLHKNQDEVVAELFEKAYKVPHEQAIKWRQSFIEERMRQLKQEKENYFVELEKLRNGHQESMKEREKYLARTEALVVYLKKRLERQVDLSREEIINREGTIKQKEESYNTEKERIATFRKKFKQYYDDKIANADLYIEKINDQIKSLEEKLKTLNSEK